MGVGCTASDGFSAPGEVTEVDLPHGKAVVFISSKLHLASARSAYQESRCDLKPGINILKNDHITSAILNSASESIPRECRVNYKPFWNDNLENATRAKNEARKNVENDNCTANKIEHF